MLRIVHVDKVDNNDAADIAEPDLVGDLPGRFHIGFKNSLGLVVLADIPSGIDVDNRQGLGRFENN